jgi:hypothetical protein
MRLPVGVCFAFAALALAACGGGSTGNFFSVPTPTPTIAPTATPAAVATSVPIGGGAALVEQPVATAVPAPAGYTASVNAPLVTTNAGTTVAVKAGTSPPPSIPVLDARTRNTIVRNVSGQYSSIYYDIVTPSQNITVAGTVSFTQQFPNGTLGATTNYYLAFYDTTVPSPAWQTIAGPVTASGNGLTFSGNPGSFTLRQNSTYAFCIFSVSASGATPPPTQAQVQAYISQGANGILVVNTAGQTVSTLPISSNSLVLDDAGNVYNLYTAPVPSPSSSASPTATPGPALIQYYPAGSTTPAGTYTNALSYGFIEGSGGGEIVYINSGTNVDGSFPLSLFVWNAGITSGAPSYTLTAQQYGSPSFDVQHDGTIYVGSLSSNGTYSYAVYPPGSTTPSRTIPETIVPAAQQANFAPNYMTVGPDGTLYVTEYSFILNDPLAGLYIYPPNGPEKFVATSSNAQGPGPEGVDVDATGNIYVANNNAGLDSTNAFTPVGDTLHDVEVFSPLGASVLRHITGTFDAYPVVAAPDGTLFFASFGFSSLTGTNGAFVIAPGGTSATQVAPLGATSIVLYNGYEESAALRRHASAASFGARAAQAGPASLRAFLKATHRIP